MSVEVKIKTEQVVEEINEVLDPKNKVDIDLIKKEAAVSSDGHTCLECNKVFTSSTNLKSHSFIHKGIKPYKCSMCEKTFAQKGNCKTHEMKYHNLQAADKSSSENVVKIKSENVHENDSGNSVETTDYESMESNSSENVVKIKSENVNENDSGNLVEETDYESIESNNEQQMDEDILNAIDNLEEPTVSLIEPPANEDVIEAIEKLENKMTSELPANEDLLEAIEKLEQHTVKKTEIKFENSLNLKNNYTCDQCNYHASTKDKLERHVNSKHIGTRYSCTFCEFNSTRKDKLSAHLKVKHDKIFNLAKEIKKLTESVVPLNIPTNLKLTEVANNTQRTTEENDIVPEDTDHDISPSTNLSIKKEIKVTEKLPVTSTNKATKAAQKKRTKNIPVKKEEKQEIVKTNVVLKTSAEKMVKSDVAPKRPEAKADKVVKNNVDLQIPVTSGYKMVKNNVATKKQITSTQKIVKSDGNIWKSNKHSTIEKNIFKINATSDESENINIFENEVHVNEQSMIDLLAEAPLAKFSKDESFSVPPSPFLAPGTKAIVPVFGKEPIIPVVQEEEQEVQPEQLSRKLFNDDDDEDFECKDCMEIFWYKTELYAHLKDVHEISDPELYKKENNFKPNKVSFKEKTKATVAVNKPTEVNKIKNPTISETNQVRKVEQTVQKPNSTKEVKNSNLKSDSRKEVKIANHIKPVEKSNIHYCGPCNFQSNRKDKLYKHLQSAKHVQNVKTNKTSSTLNNKENSMEIKKTKVDNKNTQNVKANKTSSVSIKKVNADNRKSKDEISLTSKASSSSLKWPQSVKMKQKSAEVSIKPFKAKVFETKPQDQKAKVPSKSLGYSGISITPVVSKQTASKNPISKQNPQEKLKNKTAITKGPKETAMKENLIASKVKSLPRKRSLPLPTAKEADEPKRKLAKMKHSESVDVKDDDSVDYSCSVKGCMESFWFKRQLDEHMTNVHQS